MSCIVMSQEMDLIMSQEMDLIVHLYGRRNTISVTSSCQPFKMRTVMTTSKSATFRQNCLI